MKNLVFKFLAINLVIAATISSAKANLLKYTTVVDLNEQKGKTFLALMQEQIKPQLDMYSKKGFVVADGSTLVNALNLVESKVSRKALSAAGSVEKLKNLGDLLSKQGAINFYNLPQAIANAGIGSGRYDLSTYIALVSGGGVAVKIDTNNIAYNVNYGSGAVDGDERSGRSFGEAPNRKALDASDKHYLQILENYVRTDKANTKYFYQSILEILLNNDTANYKNISAAGQAVATDFIAVYTAEQDRHLMSNLKRHHWDEALLEVTLLSAFHAGQDTVMTMFGGNLVATTIKQAPGCNTEARPQIKASMVDYWQFSKSTDPENCNRSGINITRNDFRKLGLLITKHQRQTNPQLVQNIERHFKGIRLSGNVFADLSTFLINLKTAKTLDAETLKLASDFTAFLIQVEKDASLTTTLVTSSQKQ